MQLASFPTLCFLASMLFNNMSCYLIISASQYVWFLLEHSFSASHFPTQYGTSCTVSQQAEVWACEGQSIKRIHPWGRKQANTKPRHPEEQEQEGTLFQQNKHWGDHRLWATTTTTVPHLSTVDLLCSESEEDTLRVIWSPLRGQFLGQASLTTLIACSLSVNS